MEKIYASGNLSQLFKRAWIEEEQIISINFEDLDYEELTDYRKLYKYFKGTSD